MLMGYLRSSLPPNVQVVLASHQSMIQNGKRSREGISGVK